MYVRKDNSIFISKHIVLPFVVLTWEDHECDKKMSGALGMVCQAKNYLPLTTLEAMYRSIVKPYFRFCCPVSGICGMTTLSKL